MNRRGSKLEKKAWTVFSKWIRERDKGICISCQRTFDPKEMHAGHYWHARLDFDERNINAQCKQCNYHKNGNTQSYAFYLIKKIGAKEFQKMAVDRSKVTKYSDLDYQDIIEKYSNLST